MEIEGREGEGRYGDREGEGAFLCENILYDFFSIIGRAGDIAR